jgi:2-keto-4-pentenoate hydratase/2-oxohepta-3-ene-1,7-dioic acid hydratase in catechol pathway
MGQPYSYGKKFATFCPTGPWLVTAKDLGDPRNLNMSVRFNGKMTRSGNSKQMIFDPFEVLVYCSDCTPMQAGDVISLGTFAGGVTASKGLPGATLQPTSRPDFDTREAVIRTPRRPDGRFPADRHSL